MVPFGCVTVHVCNVDPAGVLQDVVTLFKSVVFVVCAPDGCVTVVTEVPSCFCVTQVATFVVPSVVHVFVEPSPVPVVVVSTVPFVCVTVTTTLPDTYVVVHVWVPVFVSVSQSVVEAGATVVVVELVHLSAVVYCVPHQFTPLHWCEPHMHVASFLADPSCGSQAGVGEGDPGCSTPLLS
jgi:hypothetical protein